MRNLDRKRAYTRWHGIVSRCTSPQHPRWSDYGGRGISVCPEWAESFDAFYAAVGDAPPGMSLDRIDNDGNYEPGNVRWATPAEQAQNRRAQHGGKTHCPAGHQYTADNLVSRAKPRRDCKTCHRERQARRYARRVA